MKNPTPAYQRQLLLRGASAAFFRDSLNKSRQLHWHFAGKCEALLFAHGASIDEMTENLEAVARDEIHLRKQDDVPKWNHAQGMIAGLKEALGVAELAAVATPYAFDARIPAYGAVSAFEKELSKLLANAALFGSAFKPGSPLRDYFRGMETALWTAHKHSPKELGVLFNAARDDAVRMRGKKEEQHFAGIAAAYAEALVLREFAGGPA